MQRHVRDHEMVFSVEPNLNPDKLMKISHIADLPTKLGYRDDLGMIDFDSLITKIFGLNFANFVNIEFIRNLNILRELELKFFLTSAQ